MNIGYVGLGSMGGALAARLQLTHPLHVYDLNEASVRSLVERGAAPCANLRELAAHCQVVLLCLPTSSHVRTVIFAEDGLASHLASGAMIVDQSSGDPDETRAMAADLARKGIDLVDAPVSGGPPGAAAGTIAIMIGAAPEQFARVAPVLRAISPKLFHAGGVGAGHVIKLVNNMISGAQRLLSLEGLALAAKNGIDPRIACEILSAGGATNAYLATYFRQYLLAGKEMPGFSLALMHKDLRLAGQLGGSSGVPLMFGSLTREYYQACINEVGGERTVQAAALVVDRMAGTQMVPPDLKMR